MTIQILILSILLFGTTGMVIDSGRVYGLHSRMQSFADQVALAAAAELDGEPDAIARALAVRNGAEGGVGWDCDAANAASNAALVRDVGMRGVEFCIERLDFYTRFDPPAPGAPRTQADISSAYTTGFIADPTAPGAAESARYVVAHVAALEIDSAAGHLYALAAGLASAFGVTPAADPGGATVDAVAAATVVVRRCTGATTLVLCNPWEDPAGARDTYDALVEADSDGDPFTPGAAGRTAMTFASTDGAQVGSAGVGPFDWRARNQLFELLDPLPEGEACSDANLALMFGGTPPAEARSACLMARAEPDRFCWGDTVTVAPARAATVVAAMNTAFDMRLGPFDAARFAEDAAVAGVYAGQLFEPDRFVAHPYDDQRRETGPTPPENLAEYRAGPVFIDLTDYQQAEYQGIPRPGATMTEVSSDVYSYGMHDCHVESQKAAAGLPTSGAACATPFVSDRTITPNAKLARMIEGYFGPSGGGSTGGTGGLGGTTGGGTTGGGLGSGGGTTGGGLGSGGGLLGTTGGSGGGDGGLGTTGGGGHGLAFPADIDTWYGAYRWVRANQALLEAAPHANSTTYGTGETASGEPVAHAYDVRANADATDDGLAYLDTAPESYASLMAGLTLPRADGGTASCTASDPAGCLTHPGERRRIRSLVVNCEAAVEAGAEDGTYEAEVVGVMDWFLTRPVTMFCGYLNPAASGDDAVIQDILASGGSTATDYTALDCTLDTMAEARLFAEFVEDVSETALIERFTAQITQ